MVQPFLMAAITTYIWYCLHKAEIHFPKEDEGTLTTAVVATLAITFSILAALVLNSIWEKYRQVVVCILRRDMETFLLYRDERIPIIIHILLASLSMPVIVMVMLLEYRSFWSGLASISSVSFAISVYWVVALELENPSKSLWLAERVPKDWLEKDIDAHFKLEKPAPLLQ
jgi:hypothetical protein